ncbi:MAG TPA: site-specific DNA-methyltransferase [Elusimicrobiales bacterium]|nr:site-specific DNA-methyltransferase [Elusimicrobiales bacterium]
MLRVNKICCADCISFSEKLSDKSVDLVIADPPYFLKKDKWDIFSSQEEFLNFIFMWIKTVVPKIKKSGSFYIFNTPYNCAFILPYVLKMGLQFQNWITWDKRDGLASAKKKYVNGQETILFFTKSNEYTFNVNDIRIPYSSVGRMIHAEKMGILKNGKRWFPNPKGKLCGEVWHISSERHKNKINGKTPKLPHATPKPLELIERIIKASSNKGDMVLDCFMGTGTTALAAKKLGRQYIGCDVNKNYVDIANKRIKKGGF